MYLDQFATNGSYVNTVSIPEDGSSSIIAIGTPNVQGTTGNITDSGLTRSLDGRLMVVAGYNTNLTYGASLGSAPSSAVPRGVGVINAQGQYTLAVSSVATIYSQGAFRAAVTDGTNNFFGCANKGGVYYFGFTAPEGPISSLISNIRSMSVFNGNIYFAAAVAGSDGIFRIDGLPTSGAPATQLFANGTGTADMEVSPDGNLIYVADDRSSATGGGVLRYQFDGANWTLTYALTGALASGARYVTADFSGTNPVVCAVTPESENNRIVRIVDTGLSSTGTTLANAGVNQVFRGMRFGPIGAIAQPILFVARSGTNIVLSWSGTFLLQSATNVAGAYSTISGATSPYTNSVSAASQQFFRLRD